MPSSATTKCSLQTILRTDSPEPPSRATSIAPRPRSLHCGTLAAQQLPRSESEPVLSSPFSTKTNVVPILQHATTSPPLLQASAVVGIHEAACRNEATAQDLCVCPRDPKIPRPRNAFILYRQHHASSIKTQNPQLGVPDISKLIGRLWRSQTQEVKTYWNNLADEEARRHKQQHPGYRYRPRRSGRKNDSGSTSSPPGATSVCDDCGKPTSLDASIALSTAITQRTSKPDTPSPSSTTTESLLLHDIPTSAPVMNGSNRASSKRNHPPPPLRLASSTPDAPDSPGNKRCRLPGPGWAPGVPTPAYYPITPWRHSFAAPSGHSAAWFPPPHSASLPNATMHSVRADSPLRPELHGPSVSGRRESMASGGVVLPPLQLTSTSNSPPQSTALAVALKRVSSLLSIAPPLVRAPSTTAGVLIALESATSSPVPRALGGSIATALADTFAVHHAPSPASPPASPSLTDYLSLIQDAHAASAEHRALLTSLTTTSPAPVLLVENYHVASTTAWSAAITPAPNELYRDSTHWLWLATLWRGTLGPDITLLTIPSSAEEIQRSGAVDVREGERVIVVRLVQGEENLSETTMRRVAFEVREWCLKLVAPSSSSGGT